MHFYFIMGNFVVRLRDFFSVYLPMQTLFVQCVFPLLVQIQSDQHYMDTAHFILECCVQRRTVCLSVYTSPIPPLNFVNISKYPSWWHFHSMIIMEKKVPKQYMRVAETCSWIPPIPFSLIWCFCWWKDTYRQKENPFAASWESWSVKKVSKWVG